MPIFPAIDEFLLQRKPGGCDCAFEQDRSAAAAKRETLQTHLRQVEDRAYTGIDRLRQEAKAHNSQLAAQSREHATAVGEADQARRPAE